MSTAAQAKLAELEKRLAALETGAAQLRDAAAVRGVLKQLLKPLVIGYAC